MAKVPTRPPRAADKITLRQNLRETLDQPWLDGQAKEEILETLDRWLGPDQTVFADGYETEPDEAAEPTPEEVGHSLFADNWLTAAEFRRLRQHRKVMEDEGPRPLNATHLLKPYTPITCEIPKDFLVRVEKDLTKSIAKLGGNSLLYVELCASLIGSFLGAVPSYLAIQEQGYAMSLKNLSHGFFALNISVIAIFVLLAIFFTARTIREAGQKSTQVEYLEDTRAEIRRILADL